MLTFSLLNLERLLKTNRTKQNYISFTLQSLTLYPWGCSDNFYGISIYGVHAMYQIMWRPLYVCIHPWNEHVRRMLLLSSFYRRTLCLESLMIFFNQTPWQRRARFLTNISLTALLSPFTTCFLETLEIRKESKTTTTSPLKKK